PAAGYHEEAPPGISTTSLHGALPIFHAEGGVVPVQEVADLVLVRSGAQAQAVFLVAHPRFDVARFFGLQVGVLGTGVIQVREGGDRKSTRLNSSHVKISYAGFRLPKT